MLQKQEVIWFLERNRGVSQLGQLRSLATDKGDYGYSDETYREIRRLIVGKQE